MEIFNKAFINKDGSVKIYNGDCLAVLDDMIECGLYVDCIITDPPYKLSSGAEKILN